MKTTFTDVLRWIILPIVIAAVYLIVSIVLGYINPSDRGLTRLASENLFWHWVLGITEHVPNHIIATLAAIVAGSGVAPCCKERTHLIISVFFIAIFIFLLVFNLIAGSKGTLIGQALIRPVCTCIGVIIGGIIGILITPKNSL